MRFYGGKYEITIDVNHFMIVLLPMQILALEVNAGSIQSQTTIGLIKGEEEHHDVECVLYKNSRKDKERLQICQICNDKEQRSLMAQKERSLEGSQRQKYVLEMKACVKYSKSGYEKTYV